jgi:hypothetical protein
MNTFHHLTHRKEVTALDADVPLSIRIIVSESRTVGQIRSGRFNARQILRIQAA